jgi:hypothetical protein
MKTPIDSTTIPKFDAPRKPGAYIVAQDGRTIALGTDPRHYVKSRTARRRDRRTGLIKF